MLELTVALGLVVVLAGGTWFLALVPWQSQIWAGLVLVVLGLVVSLPAGFWYHVKLWRALSPRGALSPRWWLFPTRDHPSLTTAERPGVMLWFRIGAIFFGVALLGCAFLLAGGLRAR